MQRDNICAGDYLGETISRGALVPNRQAVSVSYLHSVRTLSSLNVGQIDALRGFLFSLVFVFIRGSTDSVAGNVGV